ncbi:unnamed protein product [Symbiodinium natans]|uniref:Uncharacterized protein n=1 Tax=Symbiodinium natans TaxID=878477 RepID=A0A812G755_9DINO|nr:unnamed protein product [Symbiodinium natans]
MGSGKLGSWNICSPYFGFKRIVFRSIFSEGCKGHPRKENTLAVQARPFRRCETMKQDIGIDLLADNLPKYIDTDEMVDFGQDLKTIAVERCAKLQQLARRLAMNGAASCGG